MAMFNSYVSLPEGKTGTLSHRKLLGGLEHEFYDFSFHIWESSSQLTNSIIFQDG